MFRLGVTAALVALALAACKGKTTYKDDPETTKKLDDCEKSLKEKDAYIATLTKQITDGTATTVTVNITGEAMKISGKGPHELAEGEVGSADDAKLYEAFVASLRRSRGSIQKCYQNALKNNATLQARSVTLNIEVQYKTSGSVTDARFSPRIDESFDRCMDAVTKRWTLPAMPRAVAFNYKQTLTPE
jgi:VCBS repeat-containing protein